MASVPQNYRMKASTTCFPHHDKNPSKQVNNQKQKRMQEHTKKPALSHNKAGNKPCFFIRGHPFRLSRQTKLFSRYLFYLM